MRQILSIFVLTMILISCNNTDKKAKEYTQHQTEKLNEKVDGYFSALHTIGKFNGVVFASKNDTLIINKVYNLNQDKKSTTYVTTESQFDIHSVSKLMAHYLIEKFEIEGKIKKSESIKKFIPDFPDGDKITIEMLLNHTSGLPRNLEGVEEDNINLSSEQIVEYAKKQKLLFEPGTEQQYSNVAYELVYFVIQEVSNQSFAQCLADNVFQPLEMKNSGAHFYLKEDNLKKLAKNHEKDDGKIMQVDNVLPDELKTARIFSTASDLNKFLNHVKNEPFASLLQNESNVIEKSGGSDGIRVEIYTNLEYNYNFIFLANYEEVPFQKTVEDFAKILENKPYDVPKELNRKSIKLSAEILNGYEGTYSFADMGNLELTFKVEHENLVVYQDGEQIATLKAESENTFFDDPKEPESFEFVENENDSFNVQMGWKGVKLKGIKK
ncbi:class A beta-lactamase-related serine hydrolase [Maribacter sp. MJ134]|uniref:serine hydrolase domain-containing protein n=1 Tax=Maribacter sp. MJ134 TaxID=2496865 RepID=UPI000F82914A|nr:serine hydrolase domain-containing protein [Maribacter sp. MJ134]AZQ58172.1 class A beta-lactamase-related serine hydrolase [Maribacter sp. MJ134]